MLACTFSSAMNSSSRWSWPGIWRTFMLPAIILCLSSFAEGHKGAIGAQCQSGLEGRSVGQRMVRDGPPMIVLFPDERQCFIIFLHLCPFWERIMIFCLLCPMMGRQEAHLQIRYVHAVCDFEEMYPSFIVFDMKLECACALRV
jgi:hypothetical protein